MSSLMQISQNHLTFIYTLRTKVKYNALDNIVSTISFYSTYKYLIKILDFQNSLNIDQWLNLL